MLKLLNLICFLTLLFFIGTSNSLYAIESTETEIVINSYRISGESATDEYVEIYNRTSRDINLSGWRLTKRTSSGNQSSLLTSFPAIYLEPGKSLKIGHANCLCSPDLTYSTSSSVAADNTIIIYSDNGRTVVDMVGFGSASFFEGEPTKNPSPHEVYGRKNNGIDTNNNLIDFHLLYSPPKIKEEEEKPSPPSLQPEAQKEAPLAKSYDAKIIVTEFLPNPKGADNKDEFIEIKNIGATVNISGYYISDVMGSPKSYRMPEETVIKSGEYMAFFSKNTRISLNNSGDGIEFWDPEKNIINSSLDDSGKAPEDKSYAFDGKDWSWTESPTPGKPNVIKLPVENEVMGSKIQKSSQDVPNKDIQEGGLVESNSFVNKNDRIFGVILLVVAISGAIFYTLYINKEKLIDFYHKKLKPNDKFRKGFWEKIKRR